MIEDNIDHDGANAVATDAKNLKVHGDGHTVANYKTIEFTEVPTAQHPYQKAPPYNR